MIAVLRAGSVAEIPWDFKPMGPPRLPEWPAVPVFTLRPSRPFAAATRGPAGAHCAEHMGLRIEDYAVISDTQSAALVGNNGSIDWLCLPRFDSGACFAALLGTPEHGRWLLAPEAPVRKTLRRYRGDSLVLETEFHTDDGVVRVVDGMPIRTRWPDLVRMVVGVGAGSGCGWSWSSASTTARSSPGCAGADANTLQAIGGPDALEFPSPVPTAARG